MRRIALLTTLALTLAGCAAIAPSLRESPRPDNGFAAAVEDAAPTDRSGPDYQSPISAFGAEIIHNGQWRLLREHDIVPLPDGSGAWASYLVRDCEPGVPLEDLTYSQCQARIMIFQTGANSPVTAVTSLYYMVEDVDRLSELNVPAQGEGASFSYAEGEMRGLVWGLMTGGERSSGIVVAGEWRVGSRENLMQMQFGDIARGIRLTEDACGIIAPEDLEIME